jgi:tRNA 2-thiouridine synthesizing protein E
MYHDLSNTAGHVFDADGFFLEPACWNVALARRIAYADGLGALDPAQVALLLMLRRAYDKHNAVSAMSHICHLGGYGADCMQQMFHGPREAWRIAGLPNPGDEARSYM